MARPRKKPPAAQRGAFRATAERIAEWLQTKEQLISMIETALLAERERAATTAEIYHSSGGQYIAKKIREGKPQE
jgi:hypothetical protein